MKKKDLLVLWILPVLWCVIGWAIATYHPSPVHAANDVGTVIIGPQPFTGAPSLQVSFSYFHITAATNNSIRTNPATLHNVTINGGTLTGLITIKDTSATDCSGGSTVGIIGQPQVIGADITYDITTFNGLCLITAAAVDATISFR